MKRFAITAGITSTLLVLLCVVMVQAGGVGLTIQPVKISHTIEPGKSVSGSILLSNASTQDVRVAFKVQDFVPNVGGEGVKFVSRAEGLTTVRDWITLGKGNEAIILKQDEKIQVPYTIVAPPNAEPGSHFGVIFFEATNPEVGQQLKVGTQVGTLIFVTVPGNFLQKGNITNFDAPSFVQGFSVPFEIGFENTGTVHFEPKGSILVKNLFGKTVATIPVEGQVVLPTGIKEWTVPFTVDGFLFGRYTAELSIVDGEGTVLTTEKIAFYALPIWYILSVIAGILIIFYILLFIKRRVNFSVSLKK